MTQQTIDVKQDIRAQRRAAAEHFRRRMESQGTSIVRLLSSPGAGKTTLLEKTAQRLGNDYSVGVQPDLIGIARLCADGRRHGRVV